MAERPKGLQPVRVGATYEIKLTLEQAGNGNGRDQAPLTGVATYSHIEEGAGRLWHMDTAQGNFIVPRNSVGRLVTL